MNPHSVPFGALLTAMVTPFKSNLEVDYDAAARLATKLIEDGNDGLVIAGTTGESPTLTHEEKLKLFKVVKQAVGANVPIIAGTGNYSTAESIQFTQEAESLGMDGGLIICPYYNKPPQSGLILHFQLIAAKTKLPLVIYNVPGRTSVNMLPETVEVLAKTKNIVGIKESAGSLEQASEIARRVGISHPREKVTAGGSRTDSSTVAEKPFVMWCGDDALTLPFLSVGACGVVSVAGNLTAKPIKEMITNFFDGKVAEARAIHERLLNLYKALFMTTNPIQIKMALRLAGIDVGGLRPPLLESDEKQIQALRDAMKPLGLLKH